jgi:hypothetical protein
MEELTAKPQRSLRAAKKREFRGFGVSERRSSVGFFDFMRFVVSRVEEGLAQRREDAKVERRGIEFQSFGVASSSLSICVNPVHLWFKNPEGDLQPQKGEKQAKKENPKHSHPTGTRNLDPCFS